MIKLKNLVFLATCVLGLFVAESAVATPFRLSTLNKGGAITAIGEEVITEAYRRIGESIELVYLHGSSAMQTVNEGRVDGELFRISGMENRYPNLIRVPVRVVNIEFVVFSTEPALKIRAWDDLLPYSYAYVRGIRALETRVPPSAKVSYVKNSAQAMHMLAEDRIELVLNARLNGLKTISEQGLSGIYAVKPALLTLDLFHYLHVDNQHLVAPLTAAMRNMENEGFMQHARDKMIENILSTVH